MATSSGPPAAASARRTNPPIVTPPLDTAAAAKTTKRYSYSDTPMEMQAPRFNHPVTSPTNSTIDESPITPASPASRVLPIYTEPATAHAMVKEEKERAHEQLQNSPPPQGVHPAYFAPYREDSQEQLPQQSRQQQQRQQQQYQNVQHQLHAPTENGTMPGVNITAPTPQSPNSPPHPLSTPLPPPIPLPNGTTATAYLKPSQQKKPSEPKKPPQAAATPATTATTTTSIVPDASYPPPPTAATPDHAHAHHDPNHPSSSSFSASPSAHKSRHWRHSLCDPSPTCCLSLFLPCLVYGKTQHRLNRKFAGDDPTNLLGYEACNGACGLFALACGLQGLLAALQRGRVRKAYGIEGDMATDCFKGWCCCCCVVGQDEREMKTREEERMELEQKVGNNTATTAGGRGGGAYVSPTGQMAYAPPPKVAV